MNRPLCLAITLFVLADFAHAQRRPKFTDYPVRTIYKGKPASVNLRSAEGARYYRTNLRNGARKGPNFAGHYTLIEWGCGSPCRSYGMVDARTGRVIWPPFGGMMIFDVSFRLDSRLVIVNSREVLDAAHPNGPPAWIGEWPEELFFRWNGKRFIHLKPTLRALPTRVSTVQVRGRVLSIQNPKSKIQNRNA